MKIAVSTMDSTMDAQVDSRFGRCHHYAFVDTESGEVEIIENPAVTSGSGAGIQAAQFVVERGVDTVISGHVGPNAYQVLDAAGLAVYQAAGLSIQQALDALEAGTLSELTSATGPAHMGTRQPSPTSNVGLDRQAVQAPVEAETGAATNSESSTTDEGMTPQEELAALGEEVEDLRRAVASLLEKVDKLTREG